MLPPYDATLAALRDFMLITQEIFLSDQFWLQKWNREVKISLLPKFWPSETITLHFTADSNFLYTCNTITTNRQTLVRPKVQLLMPVQRCSREAVTSTTMQTGLNSNLNLKDAAKIGVDIINHCGSCPLQFWEGIYLRWGCCKIANIISILYQWSGKTHGARDLEYPMSVCLFVNIVLHSET